MAKKILSILCALAMLVTMVSVAAFSATAAEEGYADFDGLADMTVTKDTAYYGSEWYSNNATALYDSAYYGGKVLFATQTRIVAASAGNYEIGDEFSVNYYVNRAKAGNNTVGVKYGYMNEFKLGKLYILFTSPNSPVITCSVSYNGTELATGVGSWSTFNDVAAGTEEHTAVRNDFIANFANCASAFAETENRIKFEVNITYADGKVTVVYGAIGDPAKQITVEADIADADFSDAAMELSVGEAKNDGVALYDFTGTYALPVDDEPDVPDEPVGESGNFDGIADMTVTKNTAYYNTTWWSGQGSGAYKSKYFDSTVLLSNQNVVVADSTGSYEIGDEFSMKYYLNRVEGGNTTKTGSDGLPRYGHLSEMTLGKLHISFTSSNSPEITCSISYDGTELSSGVCKYSDNISIAASSEENVAITNDFLSAYPNGGFKSTIARVNLEISITYKDGKVTVTYGAPNDASKQHTVEATIADADFSNAAMQITVGESNNQGSALYGFTGTYSLPVDDGEETDPLAPTGAAPTLNSNLTLNVAFGEAGTLAGKGYTDVKVNASIGNLGAEYELTQKTINGVTYDVAAVDFLTPDLFGEDITIEVTAKDSTGADASYTTTYSVKQYCKNIMDKDYSTELKELCMAILQFGGKVQALDGTDTITADMSTYITSYAPTAWTKGTAAWSYTGDQAIKFSGSNLNFADEIGINVYFDADGDAADYKVVSTFGTVSDVAVDGNLFMATIRISSSMLSEQTAITVRDAASNEVVSETFTLSVEDYANGGNFTGAELDCVVALMTYGDAAAAYGATLN